MGAFDPRQLPEARALVKRLAPSVVLSVGGYAAGPVSLELFNAQLWAKNPFEVAKTGFEKSRRWFE